MDCGCCGEFLICFMGVLFILFLLKFFLFNLSLFSLVLFLFVGVIIKFIVLVFNFWFWFFEFFKLLGKGWDIDWLLGVGVLCILV